MWNRSAILANQKHQEVYEVAEDISVKRIVSFFRVDDYIDSEDKLKIKKIKDELSLASYLVDNLKLSISALKYLGIEYEIKNFIKQNNINYIVIGGGSNVLFSDLGFRGLIVVNRSDKVSFDSNAVRVESGCLLSKLISKCVANSLSGLENLSGIPGTVGGAIYGNVGAYIE